jgi:hypothetical protein
MIASEEADKTAIKNSEKLNKLKDEDLIPQYFPQNFSSTALQVVFYPKETTRSKPPEQKT